VIGGLLVPRIFDLFVIGASAVSGAAMMVIGAHHVLPGLGLFDGAAGGVLPVLLTMVLAVGGASWQYGNITRSIQMLPVDSGVSDASRTDQNAPPRF
jgi:hypothetical protein